MRVVEDLGKWDRAGLDRMLNSAAILSVPDRIERISGRFLGTPYGEATLVGSPDIPEELTIRFDAVDCFTLIDYVEAMRLSGSFEGFAEELRMVRYRRGVISYETRNHFFTDWKENPWVRDVTATIGRSSATKVVKTLNRKGDGSPLLPGIPERTRELTFVPAASVDAEVADRLESGDYVGIYSDTGGLDVSHVGIIVRHEEQISFRHASLIEKVVVDQGFRAYLRGKPGIIVLRPEA